MGHRGGATVICSPVRSALSRVMFMRTSGAFHRIDKAMESVPAARRQTSRAAQEARRARETMAVIVVSLRVPTDACRRRTHWVGWILNKEPCQREERKKVERLRERKQRLALALCIEERVRC